MADLALSDGWPATVLALLYLRVCTPTCTLCGNLGKGTRTRTELNMTSGSSANQTRRLVDALESIDARSLYASNTIIFVLARFPRCHPVPLTSCPMTSSYGIPQHLCATGQDRTLGDIPEFLRLRKRDAMQQCRDGLRSTRLITLFPPVSTWITTGRHRVPFLGSCAVQHKQTLLSVRSKTHILHSIYDPLSGIA